MAPHGPLRPLLEPVWLLIAPQGPLWPRTAPTVQTATACIQPIPLLKNKQLHGILLVPDNFLLYFISFLRKFDLSGNGPKNSNIPLFV